MTGLTQKNYAQLGKKVCELYMNKGFDVNSRAEIDCEIYDMFCQLGLINDFESELSLSKKLHTSSQKIAKFKEYRFTHNRIDENDLKNNVKMILKQNYKRFYNGKLIFTVQDPSTKKYIETFLLSANETYEYTNNPKNIAINADGVIFLAMSVGCELKPLLDFIKNDKDIKKRLKVKNISITNIYNNTKSPDGILVKLIPLLSPFLTKLLSMF